MANPYYDNSDAGQRLQPGTIAEAEAIDEKFDSVATGFDGVSEDTGRALKLPAEAGVSQELAATALQRRNRVVGFDAEGRLALLTGFTWRGDWAASTEYLVNDILVDAVTGNWYRVTARHTSGSTFSTSNLALALDVGVLNQLKADTQALKEQAATSAQTATDKAAQTAADRQQTGLDRVATGEDRAAAAGSAQAASGDAEQTALDRQQTGQDRAAAKQHRDDAKRFRDEAEGFVLGDIAITDLNPGALATEKDYASVDANGGLVRRNLATDVSAQLTAGNAAAKLSRYDLSSVSNVTMLDLSQAQVFNIDASSAVTVEIINLPAAGRWMAAKLKITGPGPVTWVAPVPINWDEGAAPTLGAVATRVMLDIDSDEITGFGKELSA